MLGPVLKSIPERAWIWFQVETNSPTPRDNFQVFDVKPIFSENDDPRY